MHYVPHEDFACTVTLISGLPGSGKDTWLKRYNSELPVVSLDDVRQELDVEPTDNQGEVVQLARERCREFLRAKTSFAFNATNPASARVLTKAGFELEGTLRSHHFRDGKPFDVLFFGMMRPT